MQFRVCIAGSRGFSDYPLLRDSCDRLLGQKASIHEIVIISGTAKGADSLGEQYATERGYAVERYPADWDKYGRRAGALRNEQMCTVSDALIAFWDSKSRGTEHMIRICQGKGIPVRVIKY